MSYDNCKKFSVLKYNNLKKYFDGEQIKVRYQL